MTRTQFVYSRHDALWAYDVALGIFLKHLIDAAEASAQAKTPWLRRWVSKWRQVACISEYGLTLDRGWSELQRQTFIGLAEQACAKLATRQSIPAEEIVGWPNRRRSENLPQRRDKGGDGARDRTRACDYHDDVRTTARTA